MKTKTYTIKGNRTPADVLAGNDEILETGYTLEEAKLAAIEYQRTLKYAAAWIEEEAAESSFPGVIERTVERDCRSRVKLSVVRIDGWAI